MPKKYFRIIRVARRVLFILTFTAIAAAVLISAAGLRIELKERRIIQTSLFVVSSQPVDAELWFNEDVREGRSPWRVSGIMAGIHDLKIKKDDYNTWSKTISVAAGETVLVDEPILFMSKPEVVSLDANDQNGILAKLNNLDRDNELTVKRDTELWWRDRLVTRMSNPVYQPRMYQDDKHVSFISGGSLHITDIDGSNTYKPVNIGESDGYIFINKGATLVYEAGDKILALRIR